MAKEVTVKLSDHEYQRAQNVARLRQQGMNELLSEVIKEGLDAREVDKAAADWSEPDPAVDRERKAYLALHPKLKSEFLGKYVAIYQGEMIDHDNDPAALRARMTANHPNVFVLLTRVGPEPMRTIDVRSPRIVRGTMS